MSETIGEIVNLCDVDTGSDINRNKDMRRVGFGKKMNFGHFEYVLAEVWLRIQIWETIHIEIVKATSVDIRVC